MIYRTLSFLVCCLFISCNTPDSKQLETSPKSNMELVAIGPYSDFDYNLGSEMFNSGHYLEAKESFFQCVLKTENQTFKEDAMYNLAILCFELEQAEQAYAWMDSLIERKYTWLHWFRNESHSFSESAEYLKRLSQIETIQKRAENPANCQFHYAELDHFKMAFNSAQANWEKGADAFYSQYFSKASNALYFYQKFKIESSSHLFSLRVQEKQAYFESILTHLDEVKSFEDEIRAHFNQFEQAYPEAVFPNIHYLMGCFNAGGTSSPFGILIGAEMHLLQPQSPLENFNHWEQTVVRSADNFPLIVLHELVHIQQNDNYSNLLGNAIYEGTADFVSSLITGHHINEHIHKWVDENQKEKDIWMHFQSQMFQEDVSDWIGNADRAKEQPADLGYYIGFKICESYYLKSSNKTKALEEIIQIEHWEDFYVQSGYGKFVD